MKNIEKNKLLEYCLEHKKALTPSRYLIINTLSKYNKPKSAYEIRDIINKKRLIDINISTIYRVLEFWIKIGLVHKVSAINKYLLCSKPKDNKHIHMLNFCTKCEKVYETSNKTMSLNFKKNIEKLDLSFNKEYSIEIPVICPSCS